ncbi:MAG: ATP synthase F1 subunit delta [bacterium]|nr:ATP synthase F1 subunit delta [bacterium]
MLALANRYADSLFEIASKYKLEETILKELETFFNLINKDKEINEIWHSKSLTTFEKSKMLLDLLPFNSITKEFLKLLASKKREKLLHLIIYYYKKNYEVKYGIFEADLVLAKQTDNLVINELLRSIEKNINKKVVINDIKIDPEIMGGFILISDDTILDYSIKNSFQKLIKEININIEKFLVKSNLFNQINYNLN